jgi:CPA2 family monovalent cation:H+ antiporter-2
MDHHALPLPYFREVMIFLVAAGIVVPLMHRLRLSPVLGYLLVGALIGPFGLGLLVDRYPWLAQLVIGDVAGVRQLAELGVIFLLFLIGLELSPARLWSLRRLVFGMGSLQILITTAAIYAVIRAVGLETVPALILGACLALSSTAIVMQLLHERHQTGTALGRGSFSVLLMQDLAVVPILFLVGVLAAQDHGSVFASLALALGKAFAVVAIIYLLGRWLLRPVMRLVAGARSPEMFMAAVLLIIVGIAAVTGQAGLSMAMGAFLAGLLLAESEFQHRIELDIEPFKGLLLGLFFMSVGMGIDYRDVASEWASTFLWVLGLMALKAFIAAGLALAFRFSRATAIEMGLLLSQGGEFAFVVLGLASVNGLIAEEWTQQAMIVAGLSMVLTPAVATAGRALALRLEARKPGKEPEPDANWEGLQGHLIIAGFGRVGHTLARVLDAEALPYIAFDLDPQAVAQARSRGMPVFLGDASRLELLERARLAHASGLVVTTDQHVAADRIVRAVRKVSSDLPIYARARDPGHARLLMADGASEVVPEALEASLQLAGRVLSGAGLDTDVVSRRLDQEREASRAA